jgi:2-dehydro-3-deoxygalactonokinase
MFSKTSALAMKAGTAMYVVGSWTADALTLELIDDQGYPLDAANGPGLGQLSKSPQETLSASLAVWEQHYGPLPVVLSGMATSPLGWEKVECSLCPIDVKAFPITVRQVSMGNRIVSVVPGLKCMSRTGQLDFLWGEETQLFGAMALHPDLGRGSKTICIPGALTRWIVMRGGSALHFLTSVTGELYRLVSTDRFLGVGAGPVEIRPEIFSKGMKQAEEHGTVDLMHMLFQGRTRCLAQAITASDIPSYLLGLIIGRDVASAHALLKFDKRSSLILIADGMQQHLYAKAFEAHGFPVSTIDASRATMAGLGLIAKELNHNAQMAS